MPQQLMTFPFQIAPNGVVATRQDNTEDYYTQEIALMIGISPGERVSVPTYGVDDLVFDPSPISTLATQIEKFGPPVSIDDVTIQDIDENTTAVTVEFSPVTTATPDADFLVGS